MPVLRARRIQIQPGAVRVRTPLDVLDIGSGQQIEQIRGQAGQKLRWGAFSAHGPGSQQSRRELRLAGPLVEQLDVGDLGPAVLQSGADGPVDRLPQLDRCRQIVVGHVEGRIH
jgi:hypothetical protein